MKQGMSARAMRRTLKRQGYTARRDPNGQPVLLDASGNRVDGASLVAVLVAEAEHRYRR